jgi:signal peptidase
MADDGLFKDILIAILIVIIILSSLWAYTGQFPSSPMVVVTSGSMMHNSGSYGRIGTIDPGDLVLVKAVDNREDVKTRGESNEPTTAYKSYGDYGDVIIYRPMGNRNRTPVIHRAICWIECNGNKYTVKEYGIINGSAINIPELKLSNYRPKHSGFITMGDNNDNTCDQSGNICEQPVKPKWIIGKARGELPWFGLIKLSLVGNPDYRPDSDPLYEKYGSMKIFKAVAPSDIWACLGISIAVIIAIPVSLDIYGYYKRKEYEKI